MEDNKIVKERLLYISIMQVIAITLVFIGHSVRIFPKWAFFYSPVHSTLMQSINFIIYSFHMPLFVFISGFLLANSFSKPYRTVFQYIIGRFKRLIIPFYLFAIFWNIPLWSLANIYPDITLHDKILFILKGMNCGHLWFLAMLFCLTVIFLVIERLILKKSHVLLGLLIFIPVYFFNIHGKNDYYQIFRVNKYLIYFYLGYLCFSYRTEIFQFIEKYCLKIIFLCSLIWISLEAQLIFRGGLNQCCSLIDAIMAIILILVISKWFEEKYKNYLLNNYLFNFISTNAFLLYAFHEPIMFNILRLIKYGKDLAPLLTTSICFWGTFALSYLCVVAYNKVIHTIKNYSIKVDSVETCLNE